MMRNFLPAVLLSVLAAIACSRPEPAAPAPTKAGFGEEPVPTELLARNQMKQLNEIGKRFLLLLDGVNWDQEALFLDAAVASLKADDEWEDGASTSFQVDGVPGEARLRIEGPLSTLTLLRSGQVLSTASLQEDGAVDVHLQHYRYLSEAPAEGLSISTSALWKDGEMIASLEVTPLGEGVAKVHAQVLGGEAQIRGEVADADMQRLKLRLTPAMNEADGRALAADLDACTALGLYYPGIEAKAAVIGIDPFHRKTRFDDYWTWEWVIRFPDGLSSPVSQLTSYTELQDVSAALSAIKAQLATLLPHIYP